MPRFAANLGWMLQEVPMLERPQLARELGFRAVECPLPYDFSARDLADACQAAGLEFIMLNAPPGDMQAGEYGIAGLAGREAEFRESIGLALEYATTLDSRFIHVLAGIVPPGENIERCQDVYCENLAWAAETCARFGIGTLIEPINTHERPNYLMTLTREARKTLARVQHDNLAIQYDFHNAQLMEGSLTATITENIGLIRHMQIAGVPGRTPPDQGELNYPYLLRLIDELGYQGWVGCEYSPDGTFPDATRDALKWAKIHGLGRPGPTGD